MDDLLKNNKLIAEFMGGTIEKLVKSSDTLFFIKDKVCMGQPQWNIRYDWLMPVVEKINSFDKHGVVIHFNRTVISTHFKNKINIISSKKDESLINNTYKAVVEFIKWYNKNNKK